MAKTKKYNFLNESGLELVEEAFQEIAMHDEERKAKDLYLELREWLKEEKGLAVKQPALSQKYNEIMTQLQFIALPLLNEREVIDLVGTSLGQALAMPDYDPAQKIRSFLLKESILEERDALKQKIKKALIDNPEVITREPIMKYGDKIEGSIKNWLTDYVANLGIDIVEKVKLAQYLFAGESVKNLSPESKAKVEKLFAFFERLKFSSTSPLGAEERAMIFFNNDWQVLLDGKFEKASDSKSEAIAARAIEAVKEGGERTAKKEKESKLAESVRRAYAGDLPEQKQILADEKLVRGQITKYKKEEQPGRLEDLLLSSLTQRDRTKAVAVLRVLAEEGTLDLLLRESKKWSAVFSEYLKGRQESRPGLVEGFRLEPTAPNYISLFLQYLLRERLRQSEEDAGKVGMQLANIFKQAGNAKYSKLVYLDLADEKIKWLD